MKSTRCCAVLLVAAGLLLPGGTAEAQKVGSTAMQFLKVMPSARATGVGEAYSVWASGAEAVFWNPAGVALTGNQEASLTYTDWLFDTYQGAFAYAISLGDVGAVGFQVQYVDFGVFEETSTQRPYISDVNQPGMTGRTFNPSSMLVGVTYSKKLIEKFSIGLGVKYARESLFDAATINAQVSQGVFEDVNTWGSGILFDFGMRYNTGFRTVQIGASVQNFGADVTFAKESNPVPLLFRFGIAADVIGTNALFMENEDSRLRAAFDIFHPNDYAQQAHMGVEYEYASVFSLRAGYKFNYDFEGFTFGGGVKQSLAGMLIALDYSYGSMGLYLGSAQRISLGVILP